MEAIDSFVYCWIDNKTNMLYVGSHKGGVDDGYICSSNPMMVEYTIRPEDFVRQIIAHGSHKQILVLEYKILEAVNAAEDPQFYNKHNFGRKFINGMKGRKHSEETKQKMREAAIGKFGSERKISKEQRKKLGAERRSRALTGIKRSQKTRDKHTENNKRIGTFRKLKICEFCNREINLPNYTKWHGKRCKERINHES